MLQVSFLTKITKLIPKARKYVKIPEGMEIFHSKNPFVGDKLVYEGTKLANGPRTLARELKSFGYETTETKELLKQCDLAPELYPQMSAMLKGLDPELLQSYSSKSNIMRDMNELAEYCIKKPEHISNIKDWGSLSNIMHKEGVSLSLDDFLKHDVTDFSTAKKLLQLILKTEYKKIKDIPQIIKESKLPKEQLCNIFGNMLKLVNSSSSASRLCEGSFRSEILPQLNKEHKIAKKFENLLEELSNKEDFYKCFSESELTELPKFMEDWQIDFIKKAQIDFCEPLKHIKNAEQGQIVMNLANKEGNLNEFYKAIDKGIIDSKEAAEAYEYLTNFKINNGLVSDFIPRFTDIAREDICKNVKSKVDLEIVKLMAEKKNARGEDLYDTYSIIKILEQPDEKKSRILQKLRKEITFNSEAIEKAHQKHIEKYNNIRQHEVAESYGRFIENERQFQQEVRKIPARLKNAELLKQIAPGEVVEVGSKLIVSDGEKLIELKMDKATFTKLFISEEPLMQLFLGNCGCVSTLDAVLSTPKGKAGIYQLFEQSGDDIYINLKGFDKKIKFENGNYEKHSGLSKGAQGIKMLEQALAISHEKTKLSSKKTITVYKDLLEENGGSFINIMHHLEGVYPRDILSKIFGKYNCTDTGVFDNFADFKHLINPKKNKIALVSTVKHSINEEPSHSKWFMCHNHWHNIRNIDNWGKLEVTNPHNNSFSTKVPAYEALRSGFCDHVLFVELI